VNRSYKIKKKYYVVVIIVLDVVGRHFNSRKIFFLSSVLVYKRIIRA